MVHLDLPRNEFGVVQALITILGGSGTGKTTLQAALAPYMAPEDKEKIVSPIPALKEKLPNLEWYRLTAGNPEAVDRFFRPLVPTKREDPWPAPVFLLADEFDELCTSQGYLTQSIYDFVNYGRNFGHGAIICARGSADVTKNALQSSRVVFLAQTTEPNALRYLNDWLTDPAQPQINYKEIIKVLPSNPEDGFVFLCWAPRSPRKFQGYVEVRDGRIEPWTPERLKRRAGRDDEETGAIETSDEGGATLGSAASGATGPSPIAPGPSTAPGVSPTSGPKTSAAGRPAIEPTKR